MDIDYDLRDTTDSISRFLGLISYDFDFRQDISSGLHYLLADGDDVMLVGSHSFLKTGESFGNFFDGGENSDGTEDNDTLSYANLTSGVRISVHEEAIGGTAAVFSATDVNDRSLWEDRFTNFETIILNNQANIIEFDKEFYGLQIEGEYTFEAEKALEQGHLLDGSTLEEGFEITLEESDGSGGSISSHGATLMLANFDNVTGSEHVDTITGGSGRNDLRGGDEADTIDGGDGHDEIHGGEGGDVIFGGDGADFIYDRGADDDIREGESLNQYVNRTLAYDGQGDDEIRAGDGSDVLVYSGGTDTYYGGKGNDIYMATDRAAISSEDNDKLTIVLGDDGADFGHDLIMGDGQWIDKVQFQGLNRSDVTVSYSYEKELVHSQMFDYEFHFLTNWWGVDVDAKELKHYRTVGTMEIVVNSTGASLTIEQVQGFQTEGDNGNGITIAPAMGVRFGIEFEDGFLDWPSSVSDSADGNRTFKNSTLSETAFAALESMEEERSVSTETVEGDDAIDDELYGSIESQTFISFDGNDRIIAGGGDDILIGGAGADYLDGGSGTDTASYETATSRIAVNLTDQDLPRDGDAIGDYLVSIENVVGSSFDDSIRGSDGDNTLHGGAGNDTLRDYYGNNRLFGEEGDDDIQSRRGNDYLDGGAGNDTLRAGDGYDTVLGGEGDDLLILDGDYRIHVTPEGQSPAWFEALGVYDGGAGNDTLNVYYSGDGVVIDLAAGVMTYRTSENTVTLISIENASAGSQNDIIYGSDGDNFLNGEYGNDLIHGGAGNDTLIGGDGDDHLFGGTGIDTAKINAVSSAASFDYVDGGVRVTIDTSHPDYVWTMDEGTFIIYDDVEFIEFDDTTFTYADIAGPLQTEFEVIDDYHRFDEGGSSIVDLTENDLELNGDPISVVTVGGVTMAVGTMIRLESGATLTMLADGRLEFDQAGAYAWLEPGQTATEAVTYTATDSSGVEKTASVTLVVDGVASNPDALHLERNAVVTYPDPDGASKTSIANFNIGASIIVIDETYVDPNDLPAGVTVEEIDGHTYVLFGGDDAIVLEDISCDAWKHAAANLTLTVTDGDDVIVGEDNIGGGGGNDYLIGGATDDTLSGNDGDDEILGGSGLDTLYGGDGDDILSGGDGNDVLYGGLGEDTFDGGAGVDRIDLHRDFDGFSGTPGAYVDLSKGFIEWKNNQNGLERVSNVENVRGTIGSDTLIGDDQDNRLQAWGGDNQLVIGGGGNDHVSASGENSALYGGTGIDELSGGRGSQILNGGAGNDFVQGFDDDDVYIINLGDGNDWLFEGRGDTFGDRIVFGTGITSDMISPSVSDADNDGHDNIVLSIAGTTQTVTLEDTFFTSVDYNQAIEFLEFADGTVVELGELYSSTRYQGTSGDDSYSGTGLGEYMYGFDGADYMFGEAGNDHLFGGDGNDELRGGWGDDVHYGDAGDDLIVAFYGDDLLDGGAGNDDLQGEDGNDQLYGGDGNDFLDGGSGDDQIYGGAGDDHVIAGDGADYYDGGAGIDTLDLTNTDENYTLDLSLSQLMFADGSIEQALNFENIFAGAGDNTLTGTSQANIIDGGAGTDTITGGAGTDTLTGGAGEDTFVFSSGDGQDIITDFIPLRDAIEIDGEVLDPNAPPAGVTMTDQGSDVLISYGTGDSILIANLSMAEWVNMLNNTGDDTFAGTSASETFYGGAGNDTIDAAGGNDDLYGGTGDDDLRGGSGNDRYFIDVGDGSDIILDQSGSSDRLVFGPGITEDMLELSVSDTDGNGYNNLVITLAGTSQTITLKDAFDNIGLLADTVDHVDFADGTSTSLAALYSSKYFAGTAGDDRYLGTVLDETMYGQGGDDFIFGSNGDDVIYGGDGNDELRGGNNDDAHYGGEGDDLIAGWYGNDYLDGGTGNDTMYGEHGNDHYFIELGDGQDTIYDQEGTDRLIFGAGITQDMLEFSISNADGDDYNNLVITIAGTAQSITFEDAFDTWGIYAETVDTLEFADGSSVSLREFFSQEYFVGTDGNDSYYGTVINDTMYGAAGDDFIFGSNGNDIIHGEDGNDELRGGVGNDTHYGGGGNDLIAAWEGNDLAYGGTGDDRLYGEDGNDQLYGDDGNDTIDGGLGDDNHYGGAGDDLIIANSGADFFDGGDGVDTIDFAYTSDNVSIDLSQSQATFSSGFVEQMINFETSQEARATTP